MGNLQSYPSSRKKYDVFINFRGKDTRDCFTSHLYEALRRKGIETFIDNQIERGDELSPALMTAINESKISVVIFSEDYATAKWCLRELVEILNCKKMNNHIVLPVFYRVDPSDVRHQTKSFEAPFVEHEKNLQKEVQTWRDALAEACGIIGWHPSNGRTDATLVDEIVDDIWEKLISGYISPDFEGRIGLERIKRVISLLCLHVTIDVRIIGIWGMGGIGKTTLANDIFNKYSDAFDGFCFIPNVRERLANSGGLVSVQKEILSKVLKHEDIKLESLTIPPKIKERLNCLKVFIVLDDVDNFLQMKTLVGDVGGLGQGSRIIITSRNKQVLRKCCVNDDNIYEVKGFNRHEAFQLFCKHAFDKNCHIEDPMVSMVNRLVSFTNGNPLALIVLGSLLYKKSKQEWESVVNKFEPANLCSEIFDILKISYDRLTDREKGIFLDIACFLKGRKQDCVAKILDDCHYSLSVLIDKSLITISFFGKIEMHDLLEEMGRDIVNKESLNNIGKCSRLWRQEDVLCTLENDYGTPEVQGIFLDMFEINKDIHLSPQAFKKIYPLQALPSNYNPNNLVELDLRGSNLERLWEDSMEAPNLRWLKLQGCTRVTEIQGLKKSPLLEKINLKGCSSLLDFPQLAQHLKNLRFLDWRGCNSLRSFPSDIHFESLTSLDFSHCNNLTKFGSHISGNNITSLDLSGTAIKELHRSIALLNGLKQLLLRRCENLEMFPSDIRFESLTSLDLSDCNNLTKFGSKISGKNITSLDLSGTAIKELDQSISHLNGLKELFLRRCKNLEMFPSGIHFESLTSLDLSDCNNLTKFGSQISGNNITRLDLSGTAIKELPHSIAHLNGLEQLFLGRCENLETFPSGICNLTSLQHLDLSDCSRLEILPENLGKLKSLKYLSVKRAAIKKLPHSIADLNGLIKLFLGGCENLKTLPSGICNLTSLQQLDLSDCSRLEILPENLGDLKSLKCLSVKRAAITKLPHCIAHLNGLVELFLGGCKNLETLPSGINNLTSLQHLDLSDCSRLEILPENLGNLKSLEDSMKLLPCSLRRLFLSDCNLNYIPEDIGCLSKLIELDLSVNNFDGLPQSMLELWYLEILHLDNCNGIVSLIDLPPNLTHLSACDCKQLQSIPNALDFPRVHETKSNEWDRALIIETKSEPKPSEFIFTNCMNLEETAVGNMLARLVKYRHLDYSFSYVLYRSRRRQVPKIKRVYTSFRFCYPGREVPKWFRYRHEGSSIKFPKTFDPNLEGFAVCAVIAFEKYLFNGDSQHKLGVHFDGTCSDGDQSSPTNIMSQTAYFASRNRTLIDSDHVAFGYCYAPNRSLIERQLKNYSFEFRLSEESPNCRVKSCGVCPICYKDSDTDDSDETGTSGSRFDEEEMEPHPKENENLQAVKYAEPNEHIGETSGIRRSRTSNDHLEEEVEPHRKRLNI